VSKFRETAAALALGLLLLQMHGARARAADKSAPLVIGETFTIVSKVMEETRRINVYMSPGVRWHYEKMPDEKHSTIYHPAALKAFRAVFPPAAGR
jgi:hypothetical protein